VQQKLRNHEKSIPLYLIVFMLAALNSTAHASQNRAQVTLDPRSANDLHEPMFDLRVQRAKIYKAKISDVLLEIDTSLRTASAGKRSFSSERGKAKGARGSVNKS
jgi:hypothetical protein